MRIDRQKTKQIISFVANGDILSARAVLKEGVSEVLEAKVKLEMKKLTGSK